MANEQNLKPFNTLSPEEMKEMARKGGIASGEAKREKKAMKEIIDEILSRDISIKNSDKKVNTKEAICQAQVQRALEGNYKAFIAVRDTIGEKPVERQEHVITQAEPIESNIDKIKEWQTELNESDK